MFKFLKKSYDSIELQDRDLRSIIFLFLCLKLIYLAFINWLFLLEHILFFINYGLGAVVISLFLCDFVRLKKAQLANKPRKPIKRRIWFRCCVFLFFFIFAWFIIHILIQLEIYCLECWQNLGHFIFILLRVIPLSIVATFVLYTLGYLFKPVDRWNRGLQLYLFIFLNKIKETYLIPKVIIPFVLTITFILFFLLLAGYWIEYSRIPSLKESQCAKNDITCQQPDSSQLYDPSFQLNLNEKENNTTDSNEVKLEAETNIFRNKWIWLFALIGVGLTFWGRIIAHQQTSQIKDQIELAGEGIGQTGEQIELTRQTNIVERIQEAMKSIYDDSMGVRLAGFEIFMQIAKDNASVMPILKILLSFMHDPYLQVKKDEDATMKSFDAEEVLPKDVQKAANSISEIYKSIVDAADEELKKINNEKISLPSYFWKNKKKKPVEFPEINLRGKDLEKANLFKANLTKANLKEANLNGAFLVDAVLKKADLSNAKLRKTMSENINLEGANLLDTNLEKANLKNAILKNTKLISTKLRKVNLFNANLKGVTFKFANLEKADLSQTILKNATFYETNLRRTDLEGANITGANFEKAEYLTEEQILSAVWDDEGEEASIPKLPDEFLEVESIQRWLGKL